MPERLAKKVLLIGWDAADWKVIDPLLAAGKMPALAGLIARGVRGNIATLDPPFSPMLWTSIATGHTADRHGILNFIQPNAAGDGVRPVMGTTRKVKALWNILTQAGMTSNVVGWWPTHPAEPIRGVMVSDFAHRALNPAHVPWPILQGAIHPPELAERLGALRVHPGEITGTLLEPFIPDIASIDTRFDPRPGQLAKNLAGTATVHAITTYLLEHTDWDLTAVYFDSIDHIGHGFMQYHPPQMDVTSDEDFRLYRHVVEGVYRFHDMMLERQLELAGDDTTVVLLSDHGFHSDHLRPKVIPKMPAGPAIEHRTFGVLVMAGPGIQRGEPLYGASLLNVAPTVLTLFGLPVGRDMSAPPLVQAFEPTPTVETIPSWEEVPGDDGSHSAEARSDPWAEREALRQLVELGYVEAGTGDESARADQAAREASFNLARVYRSTGRVEEALPHFETAAASAPDDRRLAIWLAQAYLEADRPADARALVDRMLAAEPDALPLHVLNARVALREDRPADALATLDAAALDASGSPEIGLHVGDAYLALGQWEDAREAFERVIVDDPDNTRAHHGLAKAYIGEKDYVAAAEAALMAVGRRYHYPDAHFHLGVAMTRLGWIDRAEQAFQVAVAQRPAFAEAHRWLARIYNDYLRDATRAAHHLALSRGESAPSG